jgi:hypothetical protein
MRLGASQFVRAGSFLAGLAIAAVAVAGWRVPTPNAPGASLRVAAVGTSELRSASAHPFLVASNLRPGRVASGQAVLTNTMAQPLAVRVHAVPLDHDLDELLRVKASAGGKTVFAGTLGDMRSPSKRRFVVAAGAQVALKTRFWLSPSPRRGYVQRDGEIKLEFDLAPVERVG